MVFTNNVIIGKDIHSEAISVGTQELYFYLAHNFFHTLLPILSTEKYRLKKENAEIQ